MKNLPGGKEICAYLFLPSFAASTTAAADLIRGRAALSAREYYTQANLAERCTLARYYEAGLRECFIFLAFRGWCPDGRVIYGIERDAAGFVFVSAACQCCSFVYRSSPCNIHVRIFFDVHAEFSDGLKMRAAYLV